MFMKELIRPLCISMMNLVSNTVKYLEKHKSYKIQKSPQPSAERAEGFDL